MTFLWYINIKYIHKSFTIKYKYIIYLLIIKNYGNTEYKCIKYIIYKQYNCQ